MVFEKLDRHRLWERKRCRVRRREEVIQYCKSFPGVFEDYPFHDQNWTCMRLRENRKIFAWIYEKDGKIWVNVKCDTQWRDFWRKTYPSVVPAYHMNKEHWNSIILDGTVPETEIGRMIGESYDLCCVRKGGKSGKTGGR